MQTCDQGKGMDRISIGGGICIQDQAGYQTRWKITKFDESVFMNRVRKLRKRIAEALVMADYWKRKKHRVAEIEYRTLAERLLMETEQEHAYDVVCFDGNVLLNEGIDELWDLGTGTGTPTAWDTTNARLGVGDSNVAEDATQTDLQAAVNKLYKGMNGGYPTASAQAATWQSDFTGAEANYAWEEFTVDNGAVALKNLNRKVSSQGTKTSGQTWTLTLDITLS